MMQVPLVEIIDMAIVDDSGMAAVRAVLMGVAVMLMGHG
jgi:hypothetical protein